MGPIAKSNIILWERGNAVAMTGQWTSIYSSNASWILSKEIESFKQFQPLCQIFQQLNWRSFARIVIMRTSELHRCMPYNDFPPHTHSNQLLEIWVLSRSLFDVTRLVCKLCCQFGQDLELREKKRLWDNPCLRSGLESFSSKLCHHGRFLLSTVPTKPLSFLSRAGGGGEDDDDDEDLLLNYLNRELDDFQPFRCSDLVSKYLEVLNQIFKAGSKFCTSSQRIWLPAAADKIFQNENPPSFNI